MIYTTGGWFTYDYTLIKTEQPCTCGAKHTSFPNHHSDWCDIKRPSLPTAYKGLNLVFQDTTNAAPGTTYLDFNSNVLYINKIFFEKLSKQQQDALLEHEYIHYSQKKSNTIRIKLSSLQVP